MDPIGAFAGSAVTQGVTFLYEQAGEFLSAWRSRRRDRNAPPPRALDAPEGVIVTMAHPLADPPGEDAVRVLEQLRNLVEPIRSGRIDVRSPAARAVVGQLRDVVEAALQVPVRLAGEPQRTLAISDISVVTERVAGRVAGLQADLAKLPGASRVSGVEVRTGKIEPGGEVAGVRLT